MYEILQFFEEFLQADILVYILLAIDTIITICQAKVTKKLKQTSSQVVNEDIQALIGYHERMLKKLKGD